jgi:ABC-type antimicrobial peptide transport system permease subunit
MSTVQLLKRNLTYFWRTNLSVMLGVAAAVAVLAGALLVGDSVRASLRDLLLERLGKAAYVVSAPAFFRDALANELEQDEQFAANGLTAACPLIVLRGSALHEESRRQGGQVSVYGVDERFWKFHGQAADHGLVSREVLISEGLARELGARAGDSLLLNVEKPSDIPIESLHGRKEEQGRTLRLTVKSILPPSTLGDFSLLPQQSAVRAVFLPLPFLQRELAQPARVNTILVSERSGNKNAVASLQNLFQAKAQLQDLGVDIRVLPGDAGISVESQSKIINDRLADAATADAAQFSLKSVPVLSYLANSISFDGHSIPYSLVAAIDQETFGSLVPGANVERTDSIILNEWAAKDLGAQPGDPVSLEYYLWTEGGQLETKTETFRLAAVTPIAGFAADRDLVPRYPGITESQHLSDWDPPFPVDLSRVRKIDEDYWDQYRTTPKAFVLLKRGQELWQSRFGKLTSIRVTTAAGSLPEDVQNNYTSKLRADLDPAGMGFQIVAAREQGLQSSRGATDFGEYFLYFSFFLVISALLLTALFFRLGIEQRLREIGTLEALGFSPSRIRNLFLSEGFVLSVVGSLLGLVGAVAYGYLLMLGLRTWWLEAVGTTMLKLHVSWVSMILGAVGGIVASLICIILTLRGLGKTSARSLLIGDSLNKVVRLKPAIRQLRFLTTSRLAFVFTLIGVALLAAALLKQVSQAAGFFGGGSLLLIGLLCYQSAWLRRDKGKGIQSHGWWSISRLGFRNATYRPGRSLLCIALIASAAFIIVAVDAFRRSGNAQTNDRRSGTGGYPLLAESLVPLVHNPNTKEGREALNLVTDNATELNDAAITRFRLRAGDDASCLNLYRPQNPRILAAGDEFINSNRFSFQESLAKTDTQKANPWSLLNETFPDGAIPVIGDANSLTYVMHLKLGDELALNPGGPPLKLRVVGSLSDSIFQSELIMSERNFLRAFPAEQGYRFFLIETRGSDPAGVAATLEDRLSDYGFDVRSTGERLAEFHRVENTYLSTFQLLGGLGLVLGTLGMAAVLFRNVMERRRELALLRAVGYNSSHFALMVLAENIFLLLCGLASGTICALLAVAPVFFGRGGHLPNLSLVVLLVLVLLSGLSASLVATLAALRSPLIPALKTE